MLRSRGAAAPVPLGRSVALRPPIFTDMRAVASLTRLRTLALGSVDGVAATACALAPLTRLTALALEGQEGTPDAFRRFGVYLRAFRRLERLDVAILLQFTPAEGSDGESEPREWDSVDGMDMDAWEGDGEGEESVDGAEAEEDEEDEDEGMAVDAEAEADPQPPLLPELPQLPQAVQQFLAPGGAVVHMAPGGAMFQAGPGAAVFQAGPGAAVFPGEFPNGAFDMEPPPQQMAGLAPLPDMPALPNLPGLPGGLVELFNAQAVQDAAMAAAMQGQPVAPVAPRESGAEGPRRSSGGVAVGPAQAVRLREEFWDGVAAALHELPLSLGARVDVDDGPRGAEQTVQENAGAASEDEDDRWHQWELD